MTLRRALSLVIAVCIFAVAAARPAHAAGNTEEALRLGYQADKLFSEGHWDAAYDGFAKADAIAHSPVFVLYMAHARRNAGRLLEAEAIYQRVAAEKLAADAPQPFKDAVSDARRELAAVQARIPSIRLVVRGADRKSLRLVVDGAPQPASDDVRLDPGEHVIEARAGEQTMTKTVTLHEGREPLQVSFGFAGDTTDEVTRDDGGSYAPAVVALTLGGVGLVLGAITGGIASSMASDIKKNCVDGHCLAEDADRLQTAQTLAKVSTAGFAVGGAGVVTGGILLFVRPGGESGDDAAAYIGVHGSF